MSIFYLFRHIFPVMLPVLLSLKSLAQPLQEEYIISARKYSVEEGLASREVFCALQDKEGFMWVGTRYGLNRFDGRQFRLYSRQTHGLADDKVVQLALHPNGKLIIIYGHPGKPRVLVKAEVMDPYTLRITGLKEAFPGLPVPVERVIWIGNDGADLYFVSSAPLRVWKYSGNSFSLVATPGIPDRNNPNPLEQNLVPVFYKGGVILPAKPQLYVSSKTMVQFDRQKFIRFSTEGGVFLGNNKNEVYYYSPTGERKKWTGPLPLIPVSFGIHNEGNTNDRLEYNEQHGLTLLTDTARIKLLSAGDLNITNTVGVYSFFKDSQHHYWICSSSGLFKIKVERNRFRKYFTREQMGKEIQTQARGIAKAPDGRVFANLWTSIYENNLQNKVMKVGGSPTIFYGLTYHNNRLLAGGYGVFEFENGKPDFSRKLFGTLNQDVWTIDNVNDSVVLLGLEGKVAVGNLNTGNYKVIQLKNTKVSELSFVSRFIRLNDHEYWVVSTDGLYLLNFQTGSIARYIGSNAPDSNYRLPALVIHDALYTSQGAFWIATNGSGLVFFDTRKGQFKQYKIAQGLPSDILYRIETDKMGRLWISTDNGLCSFDPSTGRFENFTTANGISHNEFNRFSSYKSEEGDLFFGGLDGINQINPADFSKDGSPPAEPLRLISFNQFSGSSGLLKNRTAELLQTGNILLQPGDKFFTIDFILLDYREGKLHYAYQIEGLDKDWNLLQDNSLRISGLPSGKFTLRIRGQNADGKWSASELRFPLVVMAPLWQRPWFIAVSVICFLTLGVAIFRWRTRQLRHSRNALERTVAQRTEQLKELLDQKELMMKEIHHRVKNNLQVISGLLELQKARTDDTTTREALEEGQNRVLSIAFLHQNLYRQDDLKGVEMKTFISELTAHISDVFAREDLKVLIELEIEPLILDIEKALPLGLILNELLTNSFKYAFSGRSSGLIRCSLRRQGTGEYLFAYTDDGIGAEGAEKNATASSLGTRLIHQLSRQIEGRMDYQFKNGINFTLGFEARPEQYEK